MVEITREALIALCIFCGLGWGAVVGIVLSWFGRLG